MSQTTAASSNSDFFTGYFNGNESSQNTIPLMNVPPPPTDTSQPPPPLPSGTNALGDLSFPPPPPPLPPPSSSSSAPGVPKIDTSVPPPSIPFPPDAYQNWALQWSIFQAQQAAVYQTQLYQSFANQQKTNPTPVPPPQIPSVNNNNNNAQSKWQPSNPSTTFRPRQVQQSYRPRYPTNNNNNNSQAQSYNNVPPPANLNQPRAQQSGIRFQLNTRPQTAAATTPNKTGRRTRFSSPPKHQNNSFSSSFPTPMTTPTELRHDDTMMDTTNSHDARPVMSAIQAFKLACDKQNWPEALKKYWQSIEVRCTTNLLRSQADEWIQGVLVDAFQRNLINSIDWLNRPFPDFLLRSDNSSNVRSNTFDSTNSSLLQIAKTSYAENKQREDLARLNKLRQVTSESVLRAFGNDDDDDEDNANEQRQRSTSSSTSSSSSSSSSSTDNQQNNNSIFKKRAKKNRRARKANKKFQLDDSKPEHSERLQQRRSRFVNETTSAVIKPILAPGASNSLNDSGKSLVGTCQKLEKNYLRLTSDADPMTIRPLSILERAFPFVMNKYRANKHWPYISDQLRSIRQDLMVQSIRNDFTVLIYEENARLALEMGDREQFNQCQTQLETLYDTGCNRAHVNEFLLYRLIYSLLLNDYKKTNRILIDIDRVLKSADEYQPKDIKHLNLALDLCTAVRRKNYLQFFNIYKLLPHLAACLVNLFIEIYRKQVLKALIWGFAPSLPVETITQMLAYESIDVCQKHLSTLGVILLDDGSIDCKASRAILDKK